MCIRDSFSAGYAVALYRRGDAYTYIRPQLLFAALGAAAMYAASLVDYHAVSYTHLDVYKRQVRGHLRGCDFGGPLCKGGAFQPCSNFTDIRNPKNVVQMCIRDRYTTSSRLRLLL